MPKDTFFRLPEEKKQRIIDAASLEFRRVPYGETSINRIIKAADIPRGSFYQYFEDKQDLFLYLLSNKYDDILENLKGILRRAEGDCFRFINSLIDRFMDFYQDKGREQLMVSLTDENLFSLMLRENRENNVCESMERRVSDSLVREMDFSCITVENRQEELYLLDILWAVIADNIRTIFRKGKETSLDEEMEKLRGRIRSIEKHYRAPVK